MIFSTYAFGPIILPGEEATFLMGSPDSEPGRYSDELQHKVTLSRPFSMQTTQITQAQWQEFMGTNPSHFRGSENPVEHVSWEDCQAFIAKLNSTQEEFTYRLPTEAEWEFACRARSHGEYQGCTLDEIAWYLENSEGKTHAVGKKKPNAFGLYDMHGNVWEWCSDWYAPYEKVRLNPLGPSSGSDRVIRGGSWNSIPAYLRSARRSNVQPSSRYFDLGFRLVRTLRSSLLPSDPLPRACDSSEEAKKLIRQIRAKLRTLEGLL